MNRKGFTLIEVIMALAIVAILFLVLIPNIAVLINKNKEKSCNSLKNNVISAARIYVTNNKYELGFECSSPNNTKEITLKTLIDSGDLKKTVTNDELDLDSKVKVSYNCEKKLFTYTYDLTC